MSKRAGVAGIVLAIAMIGLGVFFWVRTPKQKISFYGEDAYEEYVGGDAYNIIIDATFKAGQTAGGRSSAAICFASAAILLVLGLRALDEADNKAKLNETASNINNMILSCEKSEIEIAQYSKIIEKRLNHISEDTENIVRILAVLDNNKVDAGTIREAED